MIDDEPVPIRARSAISSAIAQARASLHHPSRPFTPADNARHLFSLPADAAPQPGGGGGGANGGAASLGARPGSSYVISAGQFATRPGPPRLPLRGVARQERIPASSACAHAHPPARQSAVGNGGDGARRGSAGVDADVLAIDTDDPAPDSARFALDTEQRTAWAEVDVAVRAIGEAARTPRGFGGGGSRHGAAAALERAVEVACERLDAAQRLRLRSLVLDAIAPLMEASATGGATSGAGAGAGSGADDEEAAMLMRLCNVVLRLCAPSPIGGARAATPSADASPRGDASAAGGLALAPADAPLLAGCRVLFRLSKREANDGLLRGEGCLDRVLDLLRATLGELSAHHAAAVHVPPVGHRQAQPPARPRARPAPAPLPAPSFEPLIYALGALKNCSAACAPNGTHLAQRGAIKLLARLLRAHRALLGASAGREPTDAAAARDARAQLCVQATALLRNMAVSAPCRKQMVVHGLLPDLCELLVEPARADDDGGGAGGAPAAAATAGAVAGAAAAAPPRPPRPGRTVSAPPPAAPPPAAPAGSVAAPARTARAAPVELCVNVFRVLAKLTLQEDARAAVNADARHVRAMMRAMRAHGAQHAPLLVRSAFVLGNLTASNASNRELIGVELGGCELLLSLFARLAAASASAEPKHARAEPAVAPLPVPAAAGDEEVDAQVKLARLLAHLAMASAVGAQLASRAETGWLVVVLESHPLDTAEELVLNAASAITNISFHAHARPASPSTPAADSAWLPEADAMPPAPLAAARTAHARGAQPPAGLLADPPRLVRALVPLLLHSNPEGVTEAARALGNCSRDPAVRDAIVAARVHEALLLLLSHSSDAVLLAVCGVLINLAADARHRAALDEHGALRVLARLLTSALIECCGGTGGGDAELDEERAPAALCAMVGKIVYNLTLPGPSMRRLRAAPRARLVRSLVEFDRFEAARGKAEGGADEAERAEARQVAAVLHRMVVAQPAGDGEEEEDDDDDDDDDGSRDRGGVRASSSASAELGSLLEPLPHAADGEDHTPEPVETGGDDELSRLGTHRPGPLHLRQASSHDVACG